MVKNIYNCSDIQKRIISAKDTIVKPIAQTLSPKGGNVMFQDINGDIKYTNDGATIAKNIFVKGDVEDAIINIIRTGSLKTNMEAGDGTSSTVLMSGVLIEEGIKMIDMGFDRMTVRDELVKFSDSMVSELTKNAIKIKGDEDIKFIAKVSASNDEAIAEDIKNVIKIVGLDGQVMIERGYSEKTEIIEDTGFVIQSGIFSEELSNKTLQVSLTDTPVFITDKRLYYKSEAETILKTVIENGYNNVVVVAQDFIGESLPFFIANQVKGIVNIILVKEKNFDILSDLATYLGGKVISDKSGKIVNNISVDDFVIAKKVFSDRHKTIFTRDINESEKNIIKRVKMLKSILKKIGNKNDSEYQGIEKRIASLTTGMVTIKVGGVTPVEIIEKIYRYEDAINAVRGAMKDGYLAGAGISVYNALSNIKFNKDFKNMFDKVAKANIYQIARNCGKSGDVIINEIIKTKNKNFGYNAVTDKIEDIIKAGIIEPLSVPKQVIRNSVSIANAILTSQYLIVNAPEKEDK